jgi:cAMP-dependent protein kinase regulator
MWSLFKRRSPKKSKKKRSSLDETALSAEPPVGRFASRRKSVFAETYNPEDDDEDEGQKVQ